MYRVNPRTTQSVSGAASGSAAASVPRVRSRRVARRWSARWWPSIRGRPAAVTCTIAWRKLGTIDPARATEDKGYQNRLEEDEKVLAMSPHIYKPCPRLLHGERSFFETASSDRGLQLVELRLERRDLLLFRHDGGVNGRQLGQSSAGAV